MLIKIPLRVLSTLCFCFLSLIAVAQSSNYAAGELVVKFKSGYTPKYSVKNGIVSFAIKKVDELNAQYLCVSARKLNMGRKNNSYTYLLKFNRNLDMEMMARKYVNTGALSYAEPNYKGGRQGATATTPNDANFGNQWGLSNNGTVSFCPSTAGADIKMKDAWDIEKGDSSIIVAIIDGGCKMDHPEFAGRIWKNYAEIPGNNVDDDGNGYIDDVQGWNFSYVSNDPTDDEGHGTNVTSIIGANGNNSIGFAGVDWNCKLMELKGTDSDGHGYYVDWAEALSYATDNGAKVVNMSLAGSSASSVLQDGVDYAYTAGVTVIVAMGNDNSGTPVYPAKCNNVIAVGATDAQDKRVSPFFWSATSGSNWGSHISVCAPGNYIYGANHQSNTDYSWYWGGTSQATPHVSGVAALLLAQNPSRTPAQIKLILQATADDMVGTAFEDIQGFDNYYGHGRINAYRALTYHPAGVANVNSTGDAAIQPNPSTGRLDIHVAQSSMPVNYTVSNVMGAVVAKGDFNGSEYQLDLSSQPKGMYIIKLGNKEFSYVQKEILQ